MAESSRQTPVHATEYQRAYKACISCRKRKAKCDLGGRDGPPCVRCRRELRECVFSAERSWPKKRRMDDQPSHTQGSSHRPSLRDDNILQSGPRIQPGNLDRGVDNQLRDSSRTAESTHSSDDCVQDQVPDLAQSVMRTVVSNGHDVLDILYQAATQDQGSTRSEHARNVGFESQVRPSTTSLDVSSLGLNPLEPVRISPAAPNICKIWKSSRFVKMGWLTADEAVTYMDLCVSAKDKICLRR